MRKYIILLALCAATFQGCDFVRTLAGRPTAAKVEEIRQEQMRLEEARHQARIDSMKRVQAAMADSLAALEAHLIDSLSQARGTIVNPAKLGGPQRPPGSGSMSLRKSGRDCENPEAVARQGNLPGRRLDFG